MCALRGIDVDMPVAHASDERVSNAQAHYAPDAYRKSHVLRPFLVQSMRPRVCLKSSARSFEKEFRIFINYERILETCEFKVN